MAFWCHYTDEEGAYYMAQQSSNKYISKKLDSVVADIVNKENCSPDQRIGFLNIFSRLKWNQNETQQIEQKTNFCN